VSLGFRILDRYLLREFLKIFGITVLGFPLLTIAIDLTDHIGTYLNNKIPGKDIFLAYVYSVPQQVFFIIPAAVLFATVFSVGALARHSEITAAKASGISFHRLVAPVFLVAAVITVGTFFLGEFAPLANGKRAERLGERQSRHETTRNDFVYRADGGRVYVIGLLSSPERTMRDVQIEREGTGPSFPSYLLTAATGRWDPLRGWTLGRGTLRLLPGRDQEIAFGYDSLRQRALTESPLDLLAEPKQPNEMRYAELEHYVRTLERSGSDAAKLEVEKALKIAIPVTCLIIVLFGAPLGIANARAGATWGVAVSLATTIVFLTLIQITKAVGNGGAIPPLVAAWTPNVLFTLGGLVLFTRART
jgi:lipopolysaccharide export system permease protein